MRVRALVLPRPLLDAVEAAAEAAYPEECCGLLVGRPDPGGATVLVRAAEPAGNVATGRRDRFELDPQVRFDVMRRLERAGGGERIVGHYHSHPDHPPVPSATDLEMAFEPDLVWLIISVRHGRAGSAAAHIPDRPEGGFRPLDLTITDAP